MMGEQREEHDKVNHPTHYTKGIETYKYIDSWSMDYPTGNVIKYITRAAHKGTQLIDLKKARWYLDKLIEAASHEDFNKRGSK